MWEMLLLLIKDIGKVKILVYEYEIKDIDFFNNIYLKKMYYVFFLIVYENIYLLLIMFKYRICERKNIDILKCWKCLNILCIKFNFGKVMF